MNAATPLGALCNFPPTSNQLRVHLPQQQLATDVPILAAPLAHGLHEHEVAVQTATQPGNCSPPPGTYRSGAIEYCRLRFQVYLRFHVCLRLSWTSTLLAVGITPTTTAGFSKGLPALLTEFTGRLVYF